MQKNKTITRRSFLKTSAALTSTAIVLPTIVPSSVFGADAPSNRITVGAIGTGGQGTHDMRGFISKPSTKVLAVCDVDTAHRERARKVAKLPPESAYNDFRDLLARDDIDAVLVGTPDHWHVPISIAAVRAGKDVYCEKPLTLTITEGRALADAVKRYGTVFQTGTQQRSAREFRFACELVRNGYIGELETIEVNIPGNNKFCPDTWEEKPVPEGFDYDFWLGPAQWAPYTDQRCHYIFRFILDYSGGQMTNFGAHNLDIAQWALGADTTGPVEISGKGAQFPKNGLFTTATKTSVLYTYANGVKMTCKTGSFNMTFHGTEGSVFVKRGLIETTPKSLLEVKFAPGDVRLYNSNDHIRNFLDCVRLRKDPIANAETGHRSSCICHLGNIAMLLDRTVKWDPDREIFPDDPDANKMISRPMRSPWSL